ncbi:MAG: hypothetical protein ACYCQI_13315 [Gammaproteobacteria bacterium]
MKSDNNQEINAIKKERAALEEVFIDLSQKFGRIEIERDRLARSLAVDQLFLKTNDPRKSLVKTMDASHIQRMVGFPIPEPKKLDDEKERNAQSPEVPPAPKPAPREDKKDDDVPRQGRKG